jgi:hypothetical protein
MSGTASHSLLALAFALMGTAGCSLLTPPDHGPPPPVGGITDQQRASAMISVHAHARYYPNPDVMARFMPLPTAIQILHHDEGSAADSRRRRAAAKLAAYWIHRFEFETFDEEIAAIAGDAAVDAIAARLVLLQPLPAPAILEGDLLNILKFLTPLCRWEVKRLKGGVATPPPISWMFEILVPRDIPDVARSLDPQSWDECSLFFFASHLVATPSCCPKSTTSDCSCATDSAGNPQPIVPPVPRGQPFDWTALYERVCHDEQGQCQLCDTVSCDMNYKNLLCVKTDYDVPIVSSDQLGAVGRYDVEFHLGTSRAVELDGIDGYLLDSNQGNLHVREPTSGELGSVGAGDWSVVHVDKHMTFRDTGKTTEVGELLKALEDELQGELAEHACCYVAPEKWGVDLSRLFRLLEKELRLRLPPYKIPIPPVPPVR